MGHADSPLGAGKTGRDRPYRYVRKRIAKDLIMFLLNVQNLGNRFQEESGTEVPQLPRQVDTVVVEPHDVAHDPVGALASERRDQPRVLPPDPIR